MKSFSTYFCLLLIFLFCQKTEAQEWNSIISVFSNYESEGTDIELSNGKQYFLGNFENSASIGFNSIQGVAYQDIFFGKATLEGHTEWLKSITGNQIDLASAIQVYGDTLAISGIYTDSLFIEDDTLLNDYQKSTFLAFYDTSGNYLSTFSPETFNANFRDFHFDHDGNIILVGEFMNDFDYGGFHMSEISGLSTFIIKYDPFQDSILWGSHASGSSSLAEAVDVDEFGNSYVVGSYNEGTLFIDTLLNAGNGNHNLFLSKFNASGDKIWVRTVEGSDEVHGYGISLDNDGNVFCAGEYEGSVFHEGVLHTSEGMLDVMVLNYTVDGQFNWFKGIGGPESDEGYDLRIDSNNDPIVLADVGIDAEINQQTLAISGWQEPALIKLDKNNGNLISFHPLESEATTGIVEGKSISYQDDKIAITGVNRSAIILDGNTHTANTNKDFYSAVFQDSLLYHLSINSTELVDNFFCFPNPADEKITILGNHTIGNYRIVNSLGQILIEDFTEESSLSIDLTELNTGVYVFTCTLNGATHSLKYLKL